MRFKLGYATGFATGYYLGAKAGRQRYEQLNRTLQQFRRSDKVETIVDKVAEKAKDAASLAKDTVAQVLPHRSNGHANSAGDGSPNGTVTVPAVEMAPPPVNPAGPYSSSR